MCDVDAEAVDAALEPEAQDLDEVVAHLRVVPVEVRLLRRKEVQVVVAPLLVERPRGAAPVGRPVVRHTVRCRGGDVPGTVACEPGMLARGMGRDDVGDHAEVECVRLPDELVEVVERAEKRVDLDVVRDVVPVIRARRRVERRQPEGVDTELFEVLQLLRDAGDVADTVAVRVGKAPHVDLVEDGVAPPRAHFATSTSSAQVGIAERPSSARHERAAQAFACRAASRSPSPRSRQASSAPWKTSPAPSVLTMSTPEKPGTSYDSPPS